MLDLNEEFVKGANLSSCIAAVYETNFKCGGAVGYFHPAGERGVFMEVEFEKFAGELRSIIGPACFIGFGLCIREFFAVLD